MKIFNKFKELAENNEDIALVSNNGKLSYKECLKKVITLKSYFKEERKAGLIYLNKNENIILFELALNGSNNVFTPIDILTPKDRVIEIITQLNPKWIISLEDFSENGFYIKERDNNFIIWEKEENVSYTEDVSHIYFSSGSTGKPKGILLKEEPLIEVVLEQAQMIGMNKNKKFAWLLSPSFDASLSDIYLTLLSGGELHVCDFPQNKIKILTSYLIDKKITHSDISPSIIPYLKLDNSYLESVIFGGEIGKESYIKDLSRKIRMFNAYGPTETTICSSLREVNEKWLANNIGNPLKGVNFHIDENKELYISGSHLCVGYLDSELNKKKFIKINNELYYKTGDLVEYKDEEYYYLGRIDRQLKHNGVLISPEEIEKITLSCNCDNARCLIENNKLVLYYSGNINEKDLRVYLGGKINKNMIPGFIRKIENFQQNINGKTIIK